MEEIKTLSFFGAEGLSSTSANHIANLAKEYVRHCHEKLAAIRLYSTTVGLLTSSIEKKISSGLSQEELETIPAVVDQIAKANSLIAFLREAIKEKDRRAKEAQRYQGDEKRLKELVDKRNQLEAGRPVRMDYPTEESIKMDWSIGEQEKYLSLEAEAAALGKLIHEDGYLSDARIQLMKKIENPSDVQLNGTDTIIRSYTPTVTVEAVNKVYNELQAKYRSVQAELNGMKKRIDDQIASAKMATDSFYNEEMRTYNAEKKLVNDQLDEFERELDVERQRLAQNVRNLKIVVPNRLKPIYELIRND